jgi:O-antigen ligase
LGLYKLGESHLSPSTSGVAKIVTHGTTLIRSYGTFPHSNLLAAFLVTAILFNLYLLTKNYQKQTYLILSGFLILNIFGLFLTFSRAGIAAGLAGGIGFVLVQAINKEYLNFRRMIIPVTIGLVFSLGLLWPYLSTRATISDSAVKERVFYDKIGLKIIKDRPLLGTGPGVSVLHMEQYSDEQLQPWEIQPIHNYYLIALAEWGIAGIIFLLAIVGPILWLCYLTLKNRQDNWAIVLCGTGLAILFLFMFDHYFYTIWPTQLLLWIIIGLIFQQIQQKKPS